MVVQRGYRQPPSFHIDRLRQADVGYFFDVITNGFGAMPDYRAQIDAARPLGIVAYIRALQLSQHAHRRRTSRRRSDEAADSRRRAAGGRGAAQALSNGRHTQSLTTDDSRRSARLQQRALIVGVVGLVGRRDRRVR